MGSGMDTHGQEAYQVQNGCHNFVDSLDLLLLEANHLHGIGDCLELGPIVDGTLRGERNLGWGGLMGVSCEGAGISQAHGKERYTLMFLRDKTLS